MWKKLVQALLLFNILLLPSASAAKSLIFVVDVSGSMRRDKLYNVVTNSLITFIRGEFTVGDNLVLCAFGNTFYKIREFPKADISQMRSLLPDIEQLNFRDDWTYMTLAFHEIASLIDKYRKSYPNQELYVYIYTDGKNDPPNYIINPLTFEQIMEWYFNNYESKGTFLYIVTLGVQPDPEVESLVKGINRLPRPPGDDRRRAEIVTYPRTATRIVPPSPQKGPISIKPDLIKKKFCIGKDTSVFSLTFLSEFDTVAVMVASEAHIIPKSLQLRKGRNKIKFKIPTRDYQIGDHEFHLEFSAEPKRVRFNPPEVKLVLSVYKPLPLWIPLLILVIIIITAGIVLYYMTYPKFKGIYLKELDEQGTEVINYHLAQAQGFFKTSITVNHDTKKLSGIPSRAFILKLERSGALKICPLTSKVVVGEHEQTRKKFTRLPYGEFLVDGIKFIIEKKRRGR